MTGAERIVAERQRQIDVEGYDAENDDAHAPMEREIPPLLLASDCYAHVARVSLRRAGKGSDPTGPPSWWPWEDKSWKPSPDPIRNLEKAGALIAAEIDRLLRAQGRAAIQ